MGYRVFNTLSTLYTLGDSSYVVYATASAKLLRNVISIIKAKEQEVI